jgi:5-methylcytosine-specific restriction endonuclease McrA
MRMCLCGKLIEASEGRCPTCKNVENRRRALKAGKAGLRTRYWREVRLARLQMDGYRCVLQHDGCTGYAETVHIPPELKGNHLLATVETCRSACRRCHGIEDGGRAHVRR